MVLPEPMKERSKVIRPKGGDVIRIFRFLPVYGIEQEVCQTMEGGPGYSLDHSVSDAAASAPVHT